MQKALLAIAVVAMLTGLWARPAIAEIARSDAAIAGRTICWWSGWDSEQYGRDHSYVYSYHVHLYDAHQYVIRGAWSLGPDGTITLTMEGGGVLARKYDVNGDHVVELTGTLNGGQEGYFC